MAASDLPGKMQPGKRRAPHSQCERSALDGVAAGSLRYGCVRDQAEVSPDSKLSLKSVGVTSSAPASGRTSRDSRSMSPSATPWGRSVPLSTAPTPAAVRCRSPAEGFLEPRQRGARDVGRESGGAAVARHKGMADEVVRDLGEGVLEAPLDRGRSWALGRDSGVVVDTRAMGLFQSDRGVEAILGTGRVASPQPLRSCYESLRRSGRHSRCRDRGRLDSCDWLPVEPRPKPMPRAQSTMTFSSHDGVSGRRPEVNPMFR